MTDSYVDLANVSTKAENPSSENAIVSSTNPLSKAPPSRDTLFWISLFATVANTFGTISTIILAWVSKRRTDAELFLKKLEAAQKEREMAIKEREMALKEREMVFKEYLANLEVRERQLRIMQLEQQMAI